MARPVAEIRLDRVGHSLQHFQSPRLSGVGNEAARPGADSLFRIGRLTLQQVPKVGNFLRRIGKGKLFGRRLQGAVRQDRAGRMVGQVKRRDDAETVGPQGFGPFEKTDGIIEDIMRPASLGWRRVDSQAGPMQT